MHTLLQSWGSCSYPRHGLLRNPTRAVRCICQTHTLFGYSLQYPTSCQRRFERVFIGEARREIVSSVQLELAALPHVKTMTNEDLRTVAQPISHYYTTISPSTSRALADYMPMRTAFSLACVSMTIFFSSFSISFTLFRRQWQSIFKHPQRFFRGTHGRFLHNVPNLNDDDNDVTTAFLYKTDAEFLAIKGLAREVFARSDTETTSCVPPPDVWYPDITHVYPSAT